MQPCQAGLKRWGSVTQLLQQLRGSCLSAARSASRWSTYTRLGVLRGARKSCGDWQLCPSALCQSFEALVQVPAISQRAHHVGRDHTCFAQGRGNAMKFGVVAAATGWGDP